ncbi:MAG: tetratricopeptide repeat protein [Magnetococcales bacterium]|nr:tetratricopeptide repeat protein [Magnetococcales bacterium]
MTNFYLTKPTLFMLLALALFSGCGTSVQSVKNSSRFDGLMKKAQAYLDRGNPQMALVALTKAEKMQPANVDMLTNLGVAYDQLGQAGKALPVWRKAHALKPKSGAINHNLGVALMRKQLLVEAKQAFLDALADPKFDDRSETYYNLALIQQRRGAVKEMVSGLNHVLQIDSNHLPAHQVLAGYYRKMRRPDLEERHLRNILGIDPKSVATLERLAELYQQAGKRTLAKKLLQRIGIVAPESPAAKRAEVKLGEYLNQ